MGDEKVLSKDDIKGLLSGVVADTVQKSVNEAIGPLQKQQTDWMDQINAAKRRSDADKPKDNGIGAARTVRALAASNGDPERAMKWAGKALDAVWKDELGERVVKALMAGDFDQAGFMIQPEFASGIIEFLYNTARVRQAGPQVLPMNNGTLTLPRQTGSATAYYTGESTAITKSQPSGGQIVMTAKKLAALVPISNDLLRFSAGNQADMWVRNDLVHKVAIREDLAFLRGDGTQNTPKGMRYWAAAANVYASTGVTAAAVELSVQKVINNLEQSNVELDNAAWFMSPRSKNHLVNLRDANGNLVYDTIRKSKPTLFDRPVFVTTNIPNTLGGSGNASEVYLVNMMDAIIAESGGLQIEVDRSASYTDSTLVSAFERDETVVRAITLHDFAMRHDESVAIISSVTWGV